MIDLDALYRKVIAAGPPYRFFTETNPALTVNQDKLVAAEWLKPQPKAIVRFTAASFITDDARLATALLLEPGVQSGSLKAKIKFEPEPPPPEPEPVKEPEPPKRTGSRR